MVVILTSFILLGKMYTDIVKIQVIAIATKATQPR